MDKFKTTTSAFAAIKYLNVFIRNIMISKQASSE